MKRNYFWGFVAIFPYFLVVYFNIADHIHSRDYLYNSNNEIIRFWLQHWWKTLGLIMLISYLYFLIHSLIKKKWVWFVGLLLLNAFLHPFYWWFNSEKNT